MFQGLSLTLRNPAITLSPTVLPSGVVGTAYSSGVSASGGTGGPYLYSWSGNTPSGLTLNQATGAITGLPNSANNYLFSITASDGSGFTLGGSPQNYSISIFPAITISPTSIPAADTGSNYSVTFSATGGTNSGFVYSIAGLPSGMNFNPSTGMLSGIVPAGGPFAFTIGAKDSGNFTGSQMYTLSVNPALTLSPSNNSTFTGQVNSPFSQAFSAAGGSGGYSYTFSGNAVPGVSLVGNTLTGSPTKGGIYAFAITAKDSLGFSITNSYTLNVANLPVTVQPGSIPSGQVGVPYSQTFTASGGNGGPYTWTLSPGSPFGLTFTPTGTTATLAGTPTSFGSATITITASDGTLQGQTAPTLTITPATLTLTPSSIPNGTVGTAYSQLFTASGGLGTYTFSTSGKCRPDCN